MQMVKKIVTVLVVFFFALIFLAPKERLFFLAEDKLAQNDIIISKEVIKSSLMGIDIRDGELSVKGVSVATIENIDIFSLIFFSSVKLENVMLDESSKGVVPINEFNLTLSHSLFSPKSMKLLLGHGSNEIEAGIKFMEGQLRIEVEDINGSEWLKPMMKKDENGWYYETAI